MEWYFLPSAFGFVYAFYCAIRHIGGAKMTQTELNISLIIAIIVAVVSIMGSYFSLKKGMRKNKRRVDAEKEKTEAWKKEILEKQKMEETLIGIRQQNAELQSELRQTRAELRQANQIISQIQNGRNSISCDEQSLDPEL